MAEQTRKILRRFLIELAWASFVVRRKLKVRILRLRRLFIRPQLPENPDGTVMIHLGCGDIASPEFINVDVRAGPHVHYVCDVTDLSIFADDYADLVYASHVLEHVRRRSLKKTLWEWRRILKHGGILRLSVPDFDKIVHIYDSSDHDIKSILGPLMGGQEYEYNTHYCVFNRKYLDDNLRAVGFEEIRQWDPGCVSSHEFEDWAGSDFVVDGKSFPISLNLEAVK